MILLPYPSKHWEYRHVLPRRGVLHDFSFVISVWDLKDIVEGMVEAQGLGGVTQWQRH